VTSEEARQKLRELPALAELLGDSENAARFRKKARI
jgi:hypothetical protein